MKLIEVNAALEFSDTFLPDPILKMAVNAVLNNCPAAEEFEPVVHAEWEPHNVVPGFVRCSACRDCITYDEWPDGEKWKRCPNCGAHMDGGSHGGK